MTLDSTTRNRATQQSNGAVAAVAVLAEDNLLLHRLVETLLRAGYRLGAQAASVSRLCSALGVDGTDIVVVACGDSPRAGCDAVRTIVRQAPDARVVGVLTAANRGHVRRLLAAGAYGVVAAETLDTALPPTVEAVLLGQVCVPKEQRENIHAAPLTTREKQILAQVVLGLQNSEIAARLYLAESTVKSHLSSAFDKLGVRSRNEAVALIVDPSSGVGPGILTIPTQ